MSLIFRLSLCMYVCMFVCIYVYVCLSESVSEFGSTVYVCSVFPPFTDYCKFHFLFEHPVEGSLWSVQWAWPGCLNPWPTQTTKFNVMDPQNCSFHISLTTLHVCLSVCLRYIILTISLVVA